LISCRAAGAAGWPPPPPAPTKRLQLPGVLAAGLGERGAGSIVDRILIGGTVTTD
jgi:hypothetical protein